VGAFTAVSPYGADVAHTLTSGDGSKTVCVQYKDAAGNVSATATDAITLDTVAPESNIGFPEADTYTTDEYNAGCDDATPDICGTAADAGGSGVSSVDVRIRRSSDATYWNGSEWVAESTWNPASGTATWSYGFEAEEDTYTVNSRATDAADNVESTDTVTFTIDDPDPVTERPILFASSRTGYGDIYAMDSSGGGLTQLTSGNAIDAEPEWSPDGEHIAFTSTRHSNVELYVMDADGSNLRRLTMHSAIDTSPAWSPDGEKIAFGSNRGNNWDIYVVHADAVNATTNVTRLTVHSAADTFPAWSTDGAKIAFSSGRSGGGDIYSMNANGTSQTRLTTTAGIDTEPAWFGSTIAFSTNRHGSSNFEIYTMGDDGTAQARRTNQAGHDFTPTWKPDGSRIAFGTNRHGSMNFEIYSMNADGSDPTRLTTNPAVDALPDW
jgi:Tol biopolymer transport system component